MAELRNAGLQNSRRKELLPQSLNPQLQFLVSKTVHIRREPLLLRIVEVECPDRLIFAQDQNSRELLVVDSIKLCFDSVDHQELDPLVRLFEKLAYKVRFNRFCGRDARAPSRRRDARAPRRGLN